jgi:hypothetical protein
MWHNPAAWEQLQTGLGFFYTLCLLLHLGFLYVEYKKLSPIAAAMWGMLAAVYMVLAFANFGQMGLAAPQSIKDFIDWLMGPVIYTTMSVVAFAAFLYWRKFFTNPHVAWAILHLSLLGAGFAATDPNFFDKDRMAKPDNAPIPLLIYSVGFFTWLAIRRAVINDERMARGDAPLEKIEDEKVLVWPDLVYTELIAMVVFTVVLIAWGILLKAPLEPPATTAKAPNPSKAPWYFLGLQEMLVYFDPWMAGVVLPTFIIIGLIALPYIDFNRAGNGYFTFSQRPFAIIVFLFGFIVLWVTLIVLGTVLRGPNWNFFGPFSYWDPHKVDPLNNVNVSQIFWVQWLGKDIDKLSPIVRELPGFALIFVYLFVLPPLLARTILRPFFIRMGFIRFIVLVTLLQFMASLPIKMVLRWTFNLKYIVALPEVFFNI